MCLSMLSLFVFLYIELFMDLRYCYQTKKFECLSETRQHFLAEWPVFESERDSFKQKMCNNSLLQDCRFHVPDIFTRLVLGSSAVFDYNATNQSEISQVELHAREYIHEIHKKRVARLNEISTNE